MMQGIRDRAQGWLAWVVVILISIPFALWGIQEYLGVDPNVPVAEINGTEIPLAEYQRTLEERRRLPDPVTGLPVGEVADSELFKKQTIESLIDDELLLQASAGDGLRISDVHLAAAIQSQQPFIHDGRFSQESYENWLYGQGYTPGRFEYVYRRTLLAGQAFAGIVGSSFATKWETAKTVALLQQKRTYATLEVDADLADAEIRETELDGYYQAHQSEFARAENVDISYVVLSRDAISREVDVEESALKEIYESQKLNYMRPERREARHILIEIAQDADEAEVAKAKARIDDLKKQLSDGADFAELAKANSQDSGSAQQGGDLGLFGRKEMDPAFEQVAFSLSEGEISGPVRSSFGFHLIKLIRIEASQTKSFEEVSEGILHAAQAEQADQIFVDRAERMAQIAFEQPDSLQGVAETLDLKIQAYKGFKRRGNPAHVVLSELKLAAAVFEPATLEERLNSAAVDIDGERLVVVRVDEYHPRYQPKLDEIRGEVTAAFKRDRARDKAREKGEAWLADLQRGADAATIAGAAGASWSDNLTVTRSVSGRGDRIRDALFKMAKPVDEKPVYGGAQTAIGGYIIIALKGVSEAAAIDVEEERKAAVGAALARSNGQTDYRALVRSLRAAATITTFDDRL